MASRYVDSEVAVYAHLYVFVYMYIYLYSHAFIMSIHVYRYTPFRHADAVGCLRFQECSGTDRDGLDANPGSVVWGSLRFVADSKAGCRLHPTLTKIRKGPRQGT